MAYTGFLLYASNCHSFWNTLLLPLFVIISALSHRIVRLPLLLSQFLGKEMKNQVHINKIHLALIRAWKLIVFLAFIVRLVLGFRGKASAFIRADHCFLFSWTFNFGCSLF
jgi:formate-dependent nitrite reductase membrane component NrfD